MVKRFLPTASGEECTPAWHAPHACLLMLFMSSERGYARVVDKPPLPEFVAQSPNP